jgi:hypothetical protein
MTVAHIFTVAFQGIEARRSTGQEKCEAPEWRGAVFRSAVRPEKGLR